MLKRMLAVCLLVLLGALPALAATHYVSKTGTGSTCSTTDSAATNKSTIAAGLACTAAGDTLVIHAGTYAEVIGFYGTGAIPSGISDVSRTVIQSASGETVTLNGIDVISQSYVTIKGVTLNGHTNRIGRNTTGDPASTFVTFDTVLATGWTGGGGGGGAFMPGFRQEDVVSNIVLKNCSAYTNGTTNLDHGVYISARNVTIDGGSFYSNSGHGIQVYSSGSSTATTGSVIKNVIVHDNGSYGIGLYSGDGLAAYNNIVYHNGIIVAGSGGLRVGAGSGSNSTNALVFNNTLYNNTGYGIRLETSSTGTNLRNNISYNNSGVEISDGTGGTGLASSSVATRNNLCDAVISGLCAGGNPLFNNAGANDFTLQSASPAIDTGTTLATVTTDFSGVTRPQSSLYDIGAYERVATPLAAGWTQLINTKYRAFGPTLSTTGNCLNSGFNYCYDDGVRANNMVGGLQGVVDAWNSGIYDSLRDRFIFWGGGHNDYAGNEFYAFDFRTQSLSRLNNPGTPLTNCVGTAANGTQPDARHTYGGLTYLANQDAMFLEGGVWTCNAGGFVAQSNATWTYNFGTGAWTHLSPSGTLPSSVQDLIAEYDPSSGNVFVITTGGNGGLYKYTTATNTYSKLLSYNSPLFGDGVMDTLRHRLYVFGGGNSYYYDISLSNPTRQVISTSGAAAVISFSNPGLVYDSARDRIVSWIGGTSVYSLDPVTNIWTTDSYASGPGQPPYGSRVFHHFVYSTISNAFVVVNNVDTNMYAFVASGGVPDTTPPTISITYPTNGLTVSGVITITANAADNIGVAGVQFKVNGVNVGSEDTVSPYSISWDSTAVGNGSYTITAQARDTSNNTTISSTVNFTVNNIVDTTPPTVSITSPTSGAVLIGSVTLTATSSDNIGVAGVQFKINGIQIGSEDTVSPYSLLWDSTTVANGSYSITATSRDAANNSATSLGVSVTVSNAPPPPPAANGITITDKSGSTQTNRPVSIARVFKQGDIPQYAQAVINSSPILTQCDVKNRWADGSMKFGVISFVVPSITSGGTVSVSFQNQATGNNTGMLTQAQMLVAGYDFEGTIEMTGGNLQTASARTMLSAGAWSYWLQGPIVTAILIEDKTTRTYDKDFGDGSKALHPVFEAWFYPQINNVELSYTIENTWVGSSSSNSMRDLTYSLVLKSGNASPSQRYTNGSFSHIGKSRWVKKFWVKADPAAVNVNYNLPYMVTTQAIPHYDVNIVPTENLLATTYSNWTSQDPTFKTLQGNTTGDSLHSGVGSYLRGLGAAGDSDWIGLLSTWETLWLTSFDSRMYEIFIGNAELAGRIPWNFREADNSAGSGHFFDAAGTVSTQGRVVSVNARKNVTLGQESYRINCGGASFALDQINTGTQSDNLWVTDQSHIPDIAYLPYMMTGRHYFYDGLLYETAYNIANRVGCYDSNPGSYMREGEAGYLRSSQTRGQAWALRSVAYGSFLALDGSPEKAYFEDKLQNTIALYEGEKNIPLTYPAKQAHWDFGRAGGSDISPLGLMRTGDTGRAFDNACAGLAGFENGFFVNAMGMTNQLGYDTSSLLNFVNIFYAGLMLDPAANHFNVSAYVYPTDIGSPCNPISTWAAWSAAFTGADIFTSWQSDSSTGHGYGFIALSAMSFLTPYTSGAYSGQASYNFYKANKPDQGNYSTQNPKWAITPFTTITVPGPPAPPQNIRKVNN